MKMLLAAKLFLNLRSLVNVKVKFELKGGGRCIGIHWIEEGGGEMYWNVLDRMKGIGTCHMNSHIYYENK